MLTRRIGFYNNAFELFKSIAATDNRSRHWLHHRDETEGHAPILMYCCLFRRLQSKQSTEGPP